MKELWADAYEGFYDVSNFGRIRNNRTGKYLKPWGKFYDTVLFSVKGRRKAEQVHTLVAREFIGPRPKGKEVNHRDGNKRNNIWTNLEYVTPSENQYHARHLGIGAVGERVTAFAKLKAGQVIEIRRLYQTGKFSHAELGHKYGITGSAVTYIINRKSWKHI